MKMGQGKARRQHEAFEANAVHNSPHFALYPKWKQRGWIYNLEMASVMDDIHSSNGAKVLEVKGVEAALRKRGRGRDHVDLTVQQGEICGFLGVNGARKDHTIRLLMGIIAPEAGTITLMGETARRTCREAKAPHWLCVAGANLLFLDDLQGSGAVCRDSFYPTWEKGSSAGCWRVFEIPEKQKGFPISPVWHESQTRAGSGPDSETRFAHQLDEPTAGLDPVARREFMQIIVAQARQHRRTTFFSSHLIDEVERCSDRVGIIHKGQMKFEGALEELQREVRRVILPAEIPFDPGPSFPKTGEMRCWKGSAISRSAAWRKHGTLWLCRKAQVSFPYPWKIFSSPA